jgi:hypothetical protein
MQCRNELGLHTLCVTAAYGQNEGVGQTTSQ